MGMFPDLQLRAGNTTTAYRNAMTAAAAAEAIGFKFRAAQCYSLAADATMLGGQGPTFTWHQMQQLLDRSAALSVDAKSWLSSGVYAKLMITLDESLVSKDKLGVRIPDDEHKPLQAVNMSRVCFEKTSVFLKCGACGKEHLKMSKCSRCKQVFYCK
jgi:hypothetical protein